MVDEYADRLDDTGRQYLTRIKRDSERMAALVYDVKKLSVITHAEMKEERIDMSGMVREITGKLSATEPGRKAQFTIHPGLAAIGHSGMVRILLENLLDNAWKFTRPCDVSVVEFGAASAKQGSGRSEPVYFIKDNGVGFERKYADSIFTPFKRLHSAIEYSGTGIGLAAAKRIVQRHGGRIWAEAEEGQGATFFFTLGMQEKRAA